MAFNTLKEIGSQVLNQYKQGFEKVEKILGKGAEPAKTALNLYTCQPTLISFGPFTGNSCIKGAIDLFKGVEKWVKSSPAPKKESAGNPGLVCE